MSKDAVVELLNRAEEGSSLRREIDAAVESSDGGAEAFLEVAAKHGYEFTPEELGIQLFKFEHSFWCKKSGGMATSKTSDSGPEDRFFLSGTQVREMLREGKDIPEEFTRPEIAEILRESVRDKVSA